MRVASAERKHVSGFTLVEMAIVLVIIGIILAGVMKGRDIVRGSQVKQFSQQFAQKWGTVCQTYYDKTGQQLNDGGVNGGQTVGVTDGNMDGDLMDAAATIVTTLEGVGITPCTMIKSKATTLLAAPGGTPGAHCGTATTDVTNIFQNLVEGEFAGTQSISTDLVNIVLTSGAKTYRRNCVVFYNVPTDVCIGLDTAIDGRVAGQLGSFVNLGDAGGGAESYEGGDLSNVDAITLAAEIDTVDWASASDSEDVCTTAAIILDY